MGSDLHCAWLVCDHLELCGLPFWGKTWSLVRCFSVLVTHLVETSSRRTDLLIKKHEGNVRKHEDFYCKSSYHIFFVHLAIRQPVPQASVYCVQCNTKLSPPPAVTGPMAAAGVTSWPCVTAESVGPATVGKYVNLVSALGSSWLAWPLPKGLWMTACQQWKSNMNCQLISHAHINSQWISSTNHQQQ